MGSITIGNAIGTGVVAIGGGIYSGATGADFWTSVGQGAALGFGIGSVIGVVAGGTAFLSAAKGVMQSGQYLTQKNAYTALYQRSKYYFVGVNQAGTHITTFGIRTFTKTVASMLGLL